MVRENSHLRQLDSMMLASSHNLRPFVRKHIILYIISDYFVCCLTFLLAFL